MGTKLLVSPGSFSAICVTINLWLMESESCLALHKQKTAQSSLPSEGRQASKGLDKKVQTRVIGSGFSPSLVLFQKVKVN